MTNSKKELLKQRIKVEKEQKILNKAVKKQQNSLKNQLKNLKREIKQSDDIVMTKDSVNKIISKRIKKILEENDHLRRCCKTNKMLILFSCVITACGFVYLNNEKQDKN
jgi:uncharacterized protein YycO